MTLVKAEIKDMDCMAWMKCAFQTYCIAAGLSKEEQDILLTKVYYHIGKAVKHES